MTVDNPRYKLHNKDLDVGQIKCLGKWELTDGEANCRTKPSASIILVEVARESDVSNTVIVVHVSTPYAKKIIKNKE